MYKKATFLSNFVSKTVTWIVAFLYICSTFLSVVTPAEAAKNSYNNARNNYTAGDYSSDNYRGDHLEQNDSESSYSSAPVMTRSYVLTADDTLEAIAKRYNLSVEGLRQLNQNRFFRTGFANAKAGDTVDVPVAPVSDEMARYLEGRDTRNGNFASIASQAGQFLANGGHSAELESMASGYLIGRANNAINQWFNQYGTSRIQLNIDDDFSLKNSQFEMLLPLYDKGSNLVFTQSSIHRTDDRTQTNLGIGYRYFAPDFMLGGNAFWDYDISRSHSRMGLGLEYWRDYLKVSLNGYYRLSDWRHSSDLDDYYERPANGWDIRAEGYLPSFPQLGMKLNFEQYYGKEVGLFGKDSRQKNPYAVTVGATYTPFPLMTFDLEHKRGGNGNNDTRLGFELNYRFGVPLSKQLDPDAVDNMRTLAGSRYDLVNRNNNIVLEYKKEEVIRLSMAGHISGYYNETRSLGISVESKYDVSDVNVMAPALIAAGGKIIRGAGRSDYSVVLPPYQKVGSNDYTVTAIATDVKGHSSALVSTIVTVIPFKVDNANSTFTPAETTLPADEVSNVVLTLSLQTSKGTPSDIDVTEIKLDVQGRKTAKVDQYFKRVSPGIYELTVTAGTGVETLILTPSVGDERLPSAKVNFVPDITTARTTDIAVVGDGKSKVADGVNYFEFNATVRDEQGNLVPDAVVNWSQNKGTDVILSAEASGASSSSMRAGNDVTSKTNQRGIAVMRLVSTTKAAYDILVSANVLNDSNVVTAAPVSFTSGSTPAFGDGKSTFTADKLLVKANDEDTSTLTFTAKDEYGNGIKDLESRLIFAVSSGNADGVTISAVTKTEDDGVYKGTLKGTLAGAYKIVPMLDGAAVGSLAVNITLTSDGNLPDASDGHSTFTANKTIVDADNNDTATLTFEARDRFGNTINNLAGSLAFVVSTGEQTGVTISTVRKDSADGIYTATLKGTIAGRYTIIPMVGGSSVGSGLFVNITLKADRNPISNDNSTFTTDKNLVKADNTDFATLTFTTRDQFNNPINNLQARLTFVVATGSVPGVNITGVTKGAGDGVYVATLKGKTAGIYKIIPKLDNAVIEGVSLYVNITLSADGNPIDVINGYSSFTASKPSILANNIETTVLILKARDQYNNPINNLESKLNFAVLSGNAAGVTIGTIAKGAEEGTYTALVKGTIAGRYTFIPKVEDTAVEGLSAIVTLVADGNEPDGTTGKSTFTADKTSIMANDDDSSTLTFTAKDEYGNLLNNLSTSDLAFAISGGNVTGVTITAVQRGSFTGTYTAKVHGTAAGEYTIVPLYKGVQVGSLFVKISLTADSNPIDLNNTQTQFTADKTVVAANGEDFATLTFTAKDKYNNAINNLASRLKFVISSGNVAGVTIDTVTAGTTAGTYVAKIKGTVAAQYTIVPKLDDTQVGTLSVTVKLSSDNNPIDVESGATTFTTEKDVIAANDVETSTLTLTAKDKFGNPIDNLAPKLKFVISTGDVPGVTIDTVAAGGTSGTYVAKIKGTVARKFNIIPKRDDAPIGSLSVNVTLSADNNAVNAEKSTFETEKETVAANGLDTTRLVFTAKDQYDNPINNLESKLVFALSTAVTGVDITAVNRGAAAGTYVATLKGTVAGRYTISPKLSGVQVGSLSVTVTLTADGNLPVSGDGKSTFTTEKSYIAANNSETTTLTFTAKDEFNNVINNIEGKLVFAVSSGNASGVTIDTVSKGTEPGTYVAKLRGTVIGQYTIVPKYNGTAVSGLSVNVELTENIEVVMSWTDGSTTGTASVTKEFKVGVRDRSNNAYINGRNVDFTIVGDRGGRPAIYPLSITSNTSGDIPVAISDDKAEVVTVTGQIRGTPIKASLVVTIKPGAVSGSVSTVKANPSRIAADGTSTSIISYTPLDSNGNLITDLNTSSITTDIVGLSDIGLSVGPWYFDAGEGKYKATLTAGTKVGRIKVVPVISGSDGIDRSKMDYTLTLVAGDFDKHSGSVYADPDKLAANGRTQSTIVFKPKDKSGNAITSIDPRTISQKITRGSGSSLVPDTAIQMTAWSLDNGVYTSTLTSSTQTGVINIMPTVNGNDAADSGTVGTLELLPAVLPATKFEISNEGNALADGIMTEKVTITLRSETDSTVMPFKSVTVTAFNSELSICDTPQCSSGNRLTTFTGTTDGDGKVVIYMASTLAAWQGYNRYTVSSDGYNVKMQLPFGLYVDQEKSYIALSKDYLYNNGTDQIVATFRPFDKVGNEIPAGLLTMSFYTTDTDTTSVLTPQGYSATLSSRNQAFTTYQLYAVMTNYSQGWQPQPVTYNIRPETGVLLSTIDFNPKLCGLTKPDRKGNQIFVCSPSDLSKYQSSALGFVINMKKASSTWNKQMYLTSRDITGQILITEKGGSATQNCSVPVQSDSTKDGNAWMNDFGRAYPQLGLTYSLKMDFNFTSNIDTIRDYPKMGNHGLVNSDPPGGMGLCDLSNWGEINKTLSGYGNVKFAVRTFDPQGYAQFEVPLTNNRIDAGIVSPTITVSVYSTAR